MKSVVAALALLSLPVVASADEFSEYRLPTYSWQSASGSFSTNASRGSGTQDPSSWSKQSHLQGSGNAGLERAFDSDRLQHGWGLQLGAAGDGDWSKSRQDYGPGLPEISRDSRRQSAREQVGFSPWLRAYPERFPLGLEATASLAGSWYQSRSRADELQSEAIPPTEDLERYVLQLHRSDYRATLLVAVGHGIVRDATVVEDVHVLESRLLASGAITRPLSPEARGKLAGILAVAPEMSAAHDRPDRFEWREVERVLREDGALKGGSLDAYGVLRAREPYRASTGRRYRGHFVALTLQQSHLRAFARSEYQLTQKTFLGDTLSSELQSESSTSTTANSDGAYLGAKADWFRPLGWRWQLGARGRATRPLRAGEHGLDAAVNLEASWHVADRWELQGTVNHTRSYFRKDGQAYRGFDYWAVGSAAILNYLLEDRATIFARFDDGQGRSRYTASPSSSYSHSTYLSAGITWRFLGRVSAPGLFDTMTLLR